MTIRIDQIANSIINAPGVLVKVTESLGSGGNVIIDSTTWVQFLPRAGDKDFNIPLNGKYRVDLDFSCLSTPISSGTFSFKIVIDEGTETELTIGDTEDWRYKTAPILGQSIQNHFTSSVELSSGVHTLQVYGRLQPSSDAGQIEIYQDGAEGSPRATSVVFQLLAGSGAGGVLFNDGYRSENYIVTSIHPTFEDVGISISVSHTEEPLFLSLIGTAEKTSGLGKIWVRFVVDGVPVPDAYGVGESALEADVINFSTSIFTNVLNQGTSVVKLQAAVDSGTATILSTTRLYVAQYRGGLVPVQYRGVDIVGQPRAFNFEGNGLSISEVLGVANIKFIPDSRMPSLEWNSNTRVNVIQAFGELDSYFTLPDGKQRKLEQGSYFNPTTNLDTGTEQSDVWYYLYLIPDVSDDDFLSVVGSLNSPETGPTGSIYFKYIGSVRNNSSGNFLRFYQNGSIFNYANKIEPDESRGLISSNFYDPAVLLDISDVVPKTSSISLLNFYLSKDESAFDHVYGELFIDGYVDQVTTNDPSNQAFEYVLSGQSSYSYEQKNVQLPVPTSNKQIGYRIYKSIGSSVVPSDHGVFVLGWMDGYLTNASPQSLFNGTSGGAEPTYTNLTPMPSTVGGWEAGSTFESKTMTEMWDGLLYPYQYPTFSAFAISGQSIIIEVGDTIPINRTFTWSTTNSSNVATDSIALLDVTGSATIDTGLANDGSEVTTYPASPIQKTSATSHVFRIEGQNSKSETFNTTFTVYWQWKRFYGESIDAGPLEESDIEGLRVSGLASGFATTYAFSAGGYKYISYPSSFGTATSFKDQSTNLDVPFEDSYTVSVTNGFGQTTTYRVHRSANIIGAAINIIVS